MFAAVVALLIAPTLNLESQHWSDADTWFAAVLPLTGRGRDGGRGRSFRPSSAHLTSYICNTPITHLISATRHLSYILGTLKVLIIYMLSHHQPVSNRCTMAIELYKLPHSDAHLTSYICILKHILYCAL